MTPWRPQRKPFPDPRLGLRRDAIGLREVLFQSITDMAPGAAIAASIPAGCAGRRVAAAGGRLSPWWRACSAPGASACWPASCPRRDRWPPTRPAGCTRRWASWSPGATSWSAVLIPPLVLLQLGFTTARHDQLRVPRVPGEPVVAVVAGRRGDRARGGLLTASGPRPGSAPSSASPRSRCSWCWRCSSWCTPGSANTGRSSPRTYTPTGSGTRGDRRLGVHAARVRRLRGRGAAGRGGAGTRGAPSGGRCCWPRC